MNVDLHIHTTASDGVYTPSEIVKVAKESKLDLIAITDHDTMDGIEEALEAGKKYGIEVLKGVEFSVDLEDDEIHIIGFFGDTVDDNIIRLLTDLKNKRVTRAERIVEKLNKVNVNITMEDVLSFTSNPAYIGRPHIAKAMLDKGYVSCMNEAFDDYLVIGRPAYINRENSLNIEKIINSIHESKAISVLAHPGLLSNEENMYRCIDAGIKGLEVYHSSHSAEDEKKFISLCREKNLFMSGGSDFHGHKNRKPELGCVKLDMEDIKRLKGEL